MQGARTSSIRAGIALMLFVAMTPCAIVRAGDAIQLASLDRNFETPDAFPAKGILSADDERFLDDLEQRGIRYFIDEADPVTGLMPDRSVAHGGGKDIASIASVGFGLSALCIGDQHGWIAHDQAYDRSLRVLKFLREKAPQEHGHFYHFLQMRTGQRAWNCEVSNIDTALLMAGVLTARQHFAGTELASLANELYERVDWPWMLTSDGVLCMGWKSEEGFLKARWDQFNEGPLIYLLGLGSKTHPLPAESWQAWKRKPVVTYAGLSFMQCPPLFTHQYPQAWFDLRGLRDDQADYFRNAQLATLAQRQWCIDELSKRFGDYGTDLWGITASDSANGYQGWGGPPAQGKIDGSVVPCAAAGSLAFEPRLCLDVLKNLRNKYGEKGYLKYGFVDSINPAAGWYNPDVLGIDVGISVVMAENCRSGFVWKTFMSSEEAQRALRVAGFRPLSEKDAPQLAATSILDSSASQAGAGAAVGSATVAEARRR
jgi:hypothetical protein